ncbi:fibronectin type III domain-containing protein [Candidatus Roizmanbacteria bacterium]|nr:fibronectin type III domain-containing protein [Candidatus Roizmanbacteria bacterium]
MKLLKSLFLLFIIFFFSIVTLSKRDEVYAKCRDAKPSDTPRIRKIYVKPGRAILYFTAVAENNSYYFVAYGFAEGDDRFGVQFPFGPSSGHWIKYGINALSPNTTYFFKVRGGNGCKPGNWSKWRKATTPKEGSRWYSF